MPTEVKKLKKNKEENDGDTSLTLPYMRIIRLHLTLIGMWPRHQFAILRYSPLTLKNLMILYHIFLVCYKVNFIRQHGHEFSFFNLVQLYLNLFVFVVALHNFTTKRNQSYDTVFDDFTDHVHLIYFKDKSEYAKTIYNRIDAVCKILTYFVAAQIHFGEFVYNMLPVYANVKLGFFDADNEDKESFLYSEFPSKTRNIYKYMILVILNYLSIYCGYISFCISTLVVSVIMLHIYGHLTILIYNLENIPKPGGNRLMYSEMEISEIARTIKESINYHRMITGFIEKNTQTFGRMVGVYYSFHLICGCMILLSLSTLEFITIGTLISFTAAFVQQLTQLSVIFELVGLKSDELQRAVYSVPWEYMDKRNRTTVLIFLVNVQTPVTLKALGIVPVGVKTMAQILKTCFSYFLMLQTLATK